MVDQYLNIDDSRYYTSNIDMYLQEGDKMISSSSESIYSEYLSLYDVNLSGDIKPSGYINSNILNQIAFVSSLKNYPIGSDLIKIYKLAHLENSSLILKNLYNEFGKKQYLKNDSVENRNRLSQTVKDQYRPNITIIKSYKDELSRIKPNTMKNAKNTRSMSKIVINQKVDQDIL